MLEHIVQYLIEPKGSDFNMEGLENFPNLEIFSFGAIVVCKYVIKHLNFANNYRLTAEVLNYLMTSKARTWEKLATSEMEKKICCFRLNLYILAWLCYDKKIWSKNKPDSTNKRTLSNSTKIENSKIVYKNFSKNIESLQFLKDLPNDNTSIEIYIFDKDFDFEKDMIITEIIPVLEEYLTFELLNFMFEIAENFELANFKKALEKVKNNTRKLLHDKNVVDTTKILKKKTVNFADQNLLQDISTNNQVTAGVENDFQDLPKPQPIDKKPKAAEKLNVFKRPEKNDDNTKNNSKSTKDTEEDEKVIKERGDFFFENFVKKNVTNFKQNIESKADHIKSELDQNQNSKDMSKVRKELKIKKISEKQLEPIENKEIVTRRARALMPHTQHVRVFKKELPTKKDNKENYLINFKNYNMHDMLREFENDNLSDNGSLYAINRSAAKPFGYPTFDDSNKNQQEEAVKNLDLDKKSIAQSYNSDQNKNQFSNWKNDIVAMATPSKRSAISDSRSKSNKHKVRYSDPISNPTENN